jgi:DNA polymerase-4
VAARAKTYFHVDMDAFFVSVEELFDPSLKGKPVVVGGKADERGVVAAASYAARKFGVHSAMPLRTAHKLCPQAVFVEGHPERYRECSQRVLRVLQHFTPVVEMASIDEAYLDMSGTERLHGPPMRAAHNLHQRMRSDTSLNCSVGIASTRLVAKICSDQAKPNGILQILPGREAAFLAPLDIRKMPGVGKVTEKRLHDLGINKIGDLAAQEQATLRTNLGDWGITLAAKCRGEDAGGWFDTDLGEDEGPKSVSHEHTFSTDTAEPDRLESTLARLTEMVCRRLREHGLHARTVQLKLRYSDFSTITRAQSFHPPTQIDTEVLTVVRNLFAKNWQKGRAVRLLGVQTSGFDLPAPEPTLLGNDRHDKWEKALGAVDSMRDRFGDSAVSLGSGLRARFRERTHEIPAALPKGNKPQEK